MRPASSFLFIQLSNSRVKTGVFSCVLFPPLKSVALVYRKTGGFNRKNGKIYTKFMIWAESARDIVCVLAGKLL